MLIKNNLVEVDVKIKLLDGGTLPQYKTVGASGFDFHAAEDAMLHPVFKGFGGVTIRTGVCVDLPPGYEIQVRGRSGLAFQNDILAQFGTVDDDYIGEIKVRLWNLGSESFKIKKGERIAQGVLAFVPKVRWVPVSEIEKETERGTQGFGHTGK